MLSTTERKKIAKKIVYQKRKSTVSSVSVGSTNDTVSLSGKVRKERVGGTYTTATDSW